MNNPFYIAEQKRLYPYRKDCRTVKEVKEYISDLVNTGVITLDEIKKASFGDLKYRFFLNVNAFEISDGIRLYESSEIK